MRKYFRHLILAALLIGMISGTVFAGTTTVNYTAAGQNVVASWETLGTTRILQLTDSAALNGTLVYTPGQNISSGNLLTLTFSGGGFDGSAVQVCSATNADNAFTQVGLASPTAGSTTFNFQVNQAIASGRPVVFLSVNSTPGSCNATTAAADLGVAAFNLRIPSGTSTSPITVKVDAQTAGGLSVDSSTAAATIASIATEFGFTSDASTHTIDYLGTPGNGTKVINPGATTAANIVDQTVAGNVTLSQVLPAAAAGPINFAAGNAGLTVSALINLVDSASWQGISKIYLMDTTGAAVTCSNATAIVRQTSLSGTVSLNVPQSAFNAIYGNRNISLCIEPDLTTALQTRTITANVDYAVSSGGNDPSASPFAGLMLWNLNAYQAFIPWLTSNDPSGTFPATTYCLINNNSAAYNASVIVDVTASETSTALTNQSLGIILPKTSGMAIFGGTSITLGTATIDATTLSVDKRYNARITVTRNPSDITVACIQKDYSGDKRLVPVLTYEAANAAYKQ